MTTRKSYHWKCCSRSVPLGKQTLVMGILNVTPDSFSDGGQYTDPGVAVEHALEMVAQGAGIIDIGGESTRPGADPVTTEEEIKRTEPVIRKLREQSDVLISIDTMKSQTALHALDAGADIINDVSAFEADAAMVHIAAEKGAGVVLMHMKGTPRTMQQHPDYEDVVGEVSAYLKEKVAYAEAHGIGQDQIVIDPGIGFGKTVEHNLSLLRGLPRLAECGRPILVGASRKSFIGETLGKTDPTDRMAGSLGAAAWAIIHGAHILRAHDAIETCDVCGLLDRLLCDG